jgi:hypothetical protein
LPASFCRNATRAGKMWRSVVDRFAVNNFIQVFSCRSSPFVFNRSFPLFIGIYTFF